jgi:hypothetical protein
MRVAQGTMDNSEERFDRCLAYPKQAVSPDRGIPDSPKRAHRSLKA